MGSTTNICLDINLMQMIDWSLNDEESAHEGLSILFTRSAREIRSDEPSETLRPSIKTDDFYSFSETAGSRLDG